MEQGTLFPSPSQPAQQPKPAQQRKTAKTTFSREASNAARDKGCYVAATHRHEILTVAKLTAIDIALADPARECDSDRVYAQMIKDGHDTSQLGPAAGSIFKGGKWEFTGRWKNSERVSNHSAALRVWRLM